MEHRSNVNLSIFVQLARKKLQKTYSLILKNRDKFGSIDEKLFLRLADFSC